MNFVFSHEIIRMDCVCCIHITKRDESSRDLWGVRVGARSLLGGVVCVCVRVCGSGSGG